MEFSSFQHLIVKIVVFSLRKSTQIHRSKLSFLTFARDGFLTIKSDLNRVDASRGEGSGLFLYRAVKSISSERDFPKRPSGERRMLDVCLG